MDIDGEQGKAVSAEVLSAADVDFGILGKNEICCGSTVLRVGDQNSFRKIRTKNLESLNSTSAKVSKGPTASLNCPSPSRFLASANRRLSPSLQAFSQTQPSSEMRWSAIDNS